MSLTPHLNQAEVGCGSAAGNPGGFCEASGLGLRTGDFRAGKVLQVHVVQVLVLRRGHRLREGKELAQGHTAK